MTRGSISRKGLNNLKRGPNANQRGKRYSVRGKENGRLLLNKKEKLEKVPHYSSSDTSGTSDNDSDDTNDVNDNDSMKANNCNKDKYAEPIVTVISPKINRNMQEDHNQQLNSPYKYEARMSAHLHEMPIDIKTKWKIDKKDVSGFLMSFIRNVYFKEVKFLDNEDAFRVVDQAVKRKIINVTEGMSMECFRKLASTIVKQRWNEVRRQNENSLKERFGSK